MVFVREQENHLLVKVFKKNSQMSLEIKLLMNLSIGGRKPNGDFDKYVKRMRQHHVWGGEPELLMSSHVLQVPITVYMWDKKSECLKIIAEYGQEYGKENPIRVLYHGYGHYDALQTHPSPLQSKSQTHPRRLQSKMYKKR